MGKIINFNTYVNNSNKDNICDLTIEDIFNIFLIFQNKSEIFAKFDINILMQSLVKCKKTDRFSSILKNVEIEKNESGIEIINLQTVLEKKVQDKLVAPDSKNENEVYIIGTEEDFLILSSNYNSLLSYFNELMFFISMDLKYGPDKWGLVAEDEIIEVPNYPNIVTGEFINKDKNNPLIKKKIKKRAKEKLKNLMNR